MFIAAICMKPFDAKIKIAFHQFLMIGLSERYCCVKVCFLRFMLQLFQKLASKIGVK